MPMAGEIQGPVYTLEDWLGNNWKQVEYARMGGTEVWLFAEDLVTGTPRLAWVLKQRVDEVYFLYARMRDALAFVRSETNYKDVRLEPEQFVQGIEGAFTVPYDLRSQEEQRDPPKEEGCRQEPESTDSGTSSEKSEKSPPSS